MNRFIDHLSREVGFKIHAFHPVSGGDINEAYLLETSEIKIFMKSNKSSHAEAMFSTEASGLKLIESTNAIASPKVIKYGKFEDRAYLLLEWIEPSIAHPEFWDNFGKSLAQLHRHTDNEFGLDHDNFIGRLPQSNKRHQNFHEFYKTERLIPQFSKALNQGFFKIGYEKRMSRLLEKLPDIIPNERPSLLHGDLWSGNFLCMKGAEPILIDPAVYYGHREMDLAMSRLFGGFSQQFYHVYFDAFPIEKDFEGRLVIYQLYYLLVHVNLFGYSYVPSCERIIDKFQ